MKYYKILFLVIGLGLLIGCHKEAQDQIAEVDENLSNKAVVQVVVATVNATRNYIYVDNKQITGATLGTGSIFPAASTGVGFNVDPGLRSFVVRDTSAPSTTVTQVPLVFSEYFDPKGHYTIFLYDTITSPKQKTVKDNIVIPADSSSRIRFAHFVYNAAATPANVDVFSFYRNANIFTNVAFTDVTEFISYPSRISIDTLYIRPTGTQTNYIKVPISVLTPKRNYTLVYRGSDRGAVPPRTASFYATY